MKQIWKFPLLTQDAQEILMPKDAEILTIQTQAGAPQLWAMVSPSADREPRKIRTYGTGHEIESERKWDAYIGTYQIAGGALVFHVFEEK